MSTACLVVSLSFVVSTGPDIQNYVYALIRSDSPSIYGSAYQDTLARFPSLRQWLLSAFQWRFLAMSSAIVVLSFSRTGARNVFVAAVVASYVSLVACDLATGRLEGVTSAPYVLENLIADAAGAIVLAFVLVAIMMAGRGCYAHLRGPDVARGLAAAFVALILGICIGSTVFHTAEFLYRPIPVRLDAILDAPVNGVIGTKGVAADGHRKRRRAHHDEDRAPFQIFPSQIENGLLRWNSPGEDNKFAVRWSKTAKSDRFDATIEFYADCFGDAMNTATSVERHRISIEDLTELSVSLDAGPTEFGTLDRAKTSGTMTTKFGSFAMYSIDLDSGSQRSKTTQFVDKDASIAVKSEGRSLGFYLNSVLASASDTGIVASGRTATITADGKTYSVQAAKPRGTSKTIGQLACRSVDAVGASKRDRVTIGGADAYLGFVVRVNKRFEPTSVYGVEESALDILGGNGWVSFLRPVGRKSSGDPSGSADFVAFEGNIASLDINKSSTTARPTDEYHALGEFVGSFEDAAKVRLSGIAKALWKNGGRENPTKWEKLGWEQRTAILTAIFSMLAALVGYVGKRIGNNVEIDWRPRLK
ncbi:hypothetical protein IVB15_00160 [Bradyrhizobium sp. 182]|uniref:hypothetical protein n=1 Tax=Bradyrhizobium sp. 182 TaxID=2782651 RepID=UPI001FF7746D|nr:hypothetical protein [Bradyrhizobium sp. 182]MCK1526218.1 hypothetical protein [Bradyrhizobium sp. 182]